jgi:hypothetical protein
LLEDRQKPSGNRRGPGHGSVQQSRERIRRIGLADLHLTAPDSTDTKTLDDVGQFDDPRIVR